MNLGRWDVNYQKLNHIKRNDSNKDPSEGKQGFFSNLLEEKRRTLIYDTQ